MSGPNPGPCSLDDSEVVTTYAYDADGILLEGQLSDGRSEAYIRDSQGRITSIDDGVRRYEYDYSISNTIVETRFESDDVASTWTYMLDATGRPTTFTSDSGLMASYLYEDCVLVGVTGMANMQPLTLTYAYDGAGNLISRESSLGTHLQFDYSCW